MHSVSDRNFAQVVLESSHPVLVHFLAPWCGLCRLIPPLLQQVQLDWEGNLKLVSINADENFRLANTYRIKTLPTLILFERGQVIHRLEDLQAREDILKMSNFLRMEQFARSA